MNEKIKNFLLRYNLKAVVFFVFFGSLIVDNLNGIFIANNIPFFSNLGQMFRIIITIITSIFIIFLGSKKDRRIFFVFLIFFVLPIKYYFSHKEFSGLIMDLSYLLKLFLPFFILLCISILMENRKVQMSDIDYLLKIFSIIIPLTIILPTLFGLSQNSYVLGGGFKGFYVSNNEINIVLVGTFILSLYELYKFFSIKNFLILLLNIISLILIGSKTSLIIVPFSIFIYFIFYFKNNKINIIHLFFIVILIIIFISLFSNLFFEIFQRLKYYYLTIASGDGNIINFLMSERNLRILPILNENIINSPNGLENLIFGIGRFQQVDPNVLYTLIEIDIFDTLVWYGLLTCLFVVLCYNYILLYSVKKFIDNKIYIAVFIIYMLFSLFVGHVWFSPLSTTYLTLICAKLINNNIHKDQSLFVSVIIPIYNVERYLKKCLDSVINQSYRNIEIILVDDGSTDNSYQLCKIYEQKDNRIKLYTKNNGGLSDARNFGLANATGDIITFIDSDDYVDFNFIETAIELFINENVDIAVLPFNFVYSNYSKKFFDSQYIYIFDKNNAIKEIMYANKFDTNVCAKFFKSSLLNSELFPKNLFYEDLHVLYKVIFHCNRIGFCCNSFYHYIQRDTSIMHTFDNRTLNQIEAVNHILYFFEKNKARKVLSACVARKELIKIDILNKALSTNNNLMVHDEMLFVSLKNLIIIIFNIHIKLKKKLKSIYVFFLVKFKMKGEYK